MLAVGTKLKIDIHFLVRPEYSIAKGRCVMRYKIKKIRSRRLSFQRGAIALLVLVYFICVGLGEFYS